MIIMRPQDCKFAKLSDSEWIERLTAIPPDEKAHAYFFNIKCAAFLKYISITLFNNMPISSLTGALYEFLSKDGWHILKLYKQKNGASLSSYLARCAINHFTKQQKREEQLYTIHMDSPDIADELDRFTDEEENNHPPVWQAFNRLNVRDRNILRKLVIEEKSALEAADSIWPYVRSKKDWRELPVIRVQNTISMLKRRALLSLSLELENIGSR